MYLTPVHVNTIRTIWLHHANLWRKKKQEQERKRSATWLILVEYLNKTRLIKTWNCIFFFFIEIFLSFKICLKKVSDKSSASLFNPFFFSQSPVVFRWPNQCYYSAHCGSQRIYIPPVKCTLRRVPMIIRRASSRLNVIISPQRYQRSTSEAPEYTAPPLWFVRITSPVC